LFHTSLYASGRGAEPAYSKAPADLSASIILTIAAVFFRPDDAHHPDDADRPNNADRREERQPSSLFT
jgi:hypothetical protein